MELIRIDTKNTSYQIGVAEGGHLLHLYYGERVCDDMSYLLTYYERGMAGIPYDSREDTTFSPDVLPLEFPCYGCGDYRSPAFNMRDQQGIYGADLRYKEHRFVPGKYAIPGLPAVYADADEATTLEILLKDSQGRFSITLRYGILFAQDVITRSVIVKNESAQDLFMSRLQIATLDFVSGEFDLIHFHGRHMKEQNMERIPVMHGRQSVGSRRGTSSHQHNPFAILAERDATETHGTCYGMSLLYSGNFNLEAEKDQWNQTRLQLGMLDEMMDYPLKPGVDFYSPEVAMTCSTQGLAVLSHRFHDLIRGNICRGVYKTKRRPILINNWEATYFDFTGEKIMQIATEARALGIEMLVLDDGWFGSRDCDKRGLGDWYVNEGKIGGPLSTLSGKIHDLGMKFGLWIEPEMVNEDSELYREHPDWAIRIPGKPPVLGRNQLVLDFSRKEVVDDIFEKIVAVIREADVDYIKMDMNRSICDVYSNVEGFQNYGELMHRYVLGVYDFLERLLLACPDLLIEGCSSGGGRFDAGMLYYTPQIWCSDDSDGIERIDIQYGNSFGYPISTVGSHVSAVPNHQTGRVTSLHTRGVVAMSGSFGYELDISLLSWDEKREIETQILDYKKYWNVIHNGRYYRITSPYEDNMFAVWNFAWNEEEALLNIVSLRATANAPVCYAKCRGLNASAHYYCEQTKRTYSGAALEGVGVPIPVIPGEYHAMQYYFTRCKA